MPMNGDEGAGMKREFLVKQIATTGYDVLYSAKKHFATFDIIAKAPGWITTVTLGIGVLALALPTFFNNAVFGSATVLVGIGAIYFGPFQDDRERYAKAGDALLACYYDLRTLYYDVLSVEESASVAVFEDRYQAIIARSQSTWMAKHIFTSDWYAHYKIFWQAQIEWLDEQLHFKLLRDKIPLSFSVAVVVCLLVGLGFFATHIAMILQGGK